MHPRARKQRTTRQKTHQPPPPQGVRSVDKKTGKEVPYDIEDKINFSVFPGLQVRRRIIRSVRASIRARCPRDRLHRRAHHNTPPPPAPPVPAGLQGGPHNHTISGLACALKQAQGQEYINYQKQVGAAGPVQAGLGRVAQG